MLEKHLYETMEKTLRSVGLPIGVLDAEGASVYPKEKVGAIPVPGANAQEFPQRQGGLLFQRIATNPALYVTLPESTPAAEQSLRLASALVLSLLKGGHGEMTKEDLYRRVLLDGLGGTELETLALELGVEFQAERCVILFQSEGNAQEILRALTELFEGSAGDCVVDLGKNAVALVRNMDHVSYQELPEFVLAVADTTREETGLGFSAGIGEPKDTLDTLAQGLQEARSALEIGRIYHPSEHVFAYRVLLLERFLQEIPASVAKKYYELLFNRRNLRVFNEEMIKTIDTFFECHLNVSESARRLYIHRNTLVYRLDKVQRATGLDLRTFEDAITFRMLRMLGKRNEWK